MTLPIVLYGAPGSRKTIFEYAAEGNVPEVSAVVRMMGMADIYDSEGRGLLHYAAFYGQTEMIAYLARQNLPLNALGQDGLAPIHYAIANEVPASVLQLVQMGVLSTLPSNARYTPLLFAIYKHKFVIAYMLLAEGANPSELCRSGIAPVHLAAGLGALQLLEAFIDVGGRAIINLRDAHGRTPLHYAAVGGMFPH